MTPSPASGRTWTRDNACLQKGQRADQDMPQHQQQRIHGVSNRTVWGKVRRLSTWCLPEVQVNHPLRAGTTVHGNREPTRPQQQRQNDQAHYPALIPSDRRRNLPLASSTGSGIDIEQPNVDRQNTFLLISPSPPGKDSAVGSRFKANAPNSPLFDATR